MAPVRNPSATKPKSKHSSASEIAPGVFVGGWNDAVEFEGARICVLDDAPDEPLPGATHVPIYNGQSDAALPENLDRVVDLVEAARDRNEKVLLFCGHGIRRGSLAGAWYLHRHDRLPLDAAYDRVRAVRPVIEDGRTWIGHWPPPEAGVARRRKV
jgi:hypothetical protein